MIVCIVTGFHNVSDRIQVFVNQASKMTMFQDCENSWLLKPETDKSKIRFDMLVENAGNVVLM